MPRGVLSRNTITPSGNSDTPKETPQSQVTPQGASKKQGLVTTGGNGGNIKRKL